MMSGASAARADASAARKLETGDIIDKCYRLTEKLGQGGMGVVYACHHEVLGNDYAIKLLHGDQLTEENWSRFQIEAKALAKLKHPGIVTIYNMGIDAGQYPYYVMDLLSGETLDQIIRNNGPLPFEEAINIFVQVADALASAHQKHIIHRDIKPSNIMLIEEASKSIKTAKLVDFGIARYAKAGLENQSQTAAGQVFGTPYYMSPEQCQGSAVDERSDIYSFGCALFETLTGTTPFRGENAFHTFMLHQNETPPQLSQTMQAIARQTIPAALDLAMQKMLAKKPADRYQTMTQVRHDLERIGAGKDILQNALNIGESSQVKIGGAETSASKFNPTMVKYGLITTVLLALLAGGFTLAIINKPRVKDPEIKQVSPYSSSVQDIVEAQTKKHPELAVDDSSSLPGMSNLQVLFPEALSQRVGTDEEFLQIGATPDEIASLKQFDFLSVKENEKEFHREFDAFIETRKNGNFRFLLHGPKPIFRFPKDLIVGYVQFGDDKPVAARGIVAVPPGKRITFYICHATRESQKMLAFFGPEDLNGLELQMVNIPSVIRNISHWKKLDNLSFINTLQKSLPKYRSFDESSIEDSDLPSLEQFKHLRTLGLCHLVSGPAILKMPLLHRLDTLKLKETINLSPLLKGLGNYSNIKELWLISCKIGDKDLKYLAAMKNLSTLRLRRSQLTPASAGEFQKFKALKHLILDRPWTAAEKEIFKKKVPSVEFESVLDRSYWECLPADHPALKN